MKQLTCEMCGSTDLIKSDGVFACQSCGCKYSVEEAKKMMVEITGSIKIDKTDDKNNFVILMKNAYEQGNIREALQYSDEVLKIEPNHFWAWFVKGKAAAAKTNSYNTLQELIDSIKEYTRCYINATIFAPDDEKTSIEELCKTDTIKKASDICASVSVKVASSFNNELAAYQYSTIVKELAVSFNQFTKVFVYNFETDKCQMIMNSMGDVQSICKKNHENYLSMQNPDYGACTSMQSFFITAWSFLEHIEPLITENQNTLTACAERYYEETICIFNRMKSLEYYNETVHFNSGNPAALIPIIGDFIEDDEGASLYYEKHAYFNTEGLRDIENHKSKATQRYLELCPDKQQNVEDMQKQLEKIKIEISMLESRRMELKAQLGKRRNQFNKKSLDLGLEISQLERQIKEMKNNYSIESA